MTELIQLGKSTYYIDLPSKVGIYEFAPGRVILIDTSTADAARKIEAVLEERGWKPEYIVNTHSHVDHVGCNNFLQAKYGCMAYAHEVEASFIKEPLMAACFLYGGHPYKIMRHSFLMAKPSKCEDLALCPLPEGFETFLLSGHAMGMTAVRTPDNIWFVGDIATSEEILNKYHIAFTYDPGEYLKSLDTALTLKGDMFVCAHAEPVKDLGPLIEFNRRKMEDIMDNVINICRSDPQSFEHIFKGVSDHYGLELNFMLAANAGSAVRSVISTLVDARRLKSAVQDNIVVYSALL
ncbi:MBL fold metallo-hydrolase [bacterium]|nr:MBL fold metallo-hydrolase [bacterium]